MTLCAYGDLMRVPGSNGSSLIKARAEGADIRMVYSTLDAIRIAEAEPDREVVFFAIGFETTTPPTALAIRAAEKKGLKNFSILCNHVMTPPAMRAILDGASDGDDAPVLIEGFIGPAHVSTVIGLEPYQPFASDYGKPVVIAGFEPLDVAQAILMLVRQINEGRAEVENQYIRAVTPSGNVKAQAEVAAVFETRETFEWRGLGFLPMSALRTQARVRRLRRGASLRPRREARQRQSGVRVRRDPARRQGAAGMQAVRRGLHARHADGILHGVARGRLRGALDLRPVPRERAGRAAEGRRVSPEKPVRRKLDLKHGRVDLSHGAGGRAMGQLIEDIFLAAFDNDWLRAGNDQSAFDVAAGRMVMTTDAYVVSPIFFPGGDIGALAVNGTINDIAMAGARPLFLSASFVVEEGFPLADLERVAKSMGEASRSAGVPIITGDTKVVERGKADKVFVTTAGVGVVPPGLALSSDAARPGDVVIVSGTIGDHGVAVMSKRENLEFETEILSDTAALHGLVADMVAAAGAGPARHARSDARRPRGDAQRTRPSVRGRLLDRGGRDPGPRRGRRGLRVPRPRSLERRQRRQARGDRRAGSRGRRCSPRCGRIRSAQTPRSSAGRSRTRTASSRCAPPSAAGESSTGSPASSFRGSADPATGGGRALARRPSGRRSRGRLTPSSAPRPASRRSAPRPERWRLRRRPRGPVPGPRTRSS